MKVKKGSEKIGLKLSIENTKFMASRVHRFGQIDRERMGTVTNLIFLGSKLTEDGDCSHEIKTLAPWKKSYDKPTQHLKRRHGHHFADKGPSCQSYGYSSTHIWMWELDHKEGWAPKNCCFWTVVVGKTIMSPLCCKEIKPVNPKGNEPWIFIGRPDAEPETPILWPPDAKNQLTGKDPDWQILRAEGEEES